MQERSLRPSSGTAPLFAPSYSFSIAYFLPSCKCHLPLSVGSNSARAASRHRQQVLYVKSTAYATVSLRVRLLRVVCYRLIGLIVKMMKITSSAVTLRRVALTAP